MKKALSFRYALPAAAALFALYLAGGCLDYKQHIAIRKDGSATVTVEGWVDAILKDASEHAEPGGLGNIFLADLEGKEGISILDSAVDVNEETGVEHHYVKFEAESAEALGAVPPFKNGIKIDWGADNDEIVFEEKIENEVKELDNPADEETFKFLLEGYTWTYAVEMPGEVTDTNGTVSANGRTVTWSWSLYEFSRTNEVIMRAKCLQPAE